MPAWLIRARSIVAAAAALLCLSFPAPAAPPQTMEFQGYLADSGGTPLNTSVTVVFSVYTAPSGGAPIWTETQSVSVANGVFTVLLGSINPMNLAFDVPYYVGIAVGADAEMTPRPALAMAPYSMSSANVSCTPSDIRDCYSGSVSTLDVGTCKAGQRACVSGYFAACTGQVLPASETCNGLDDDCNGVLDNGAICAPVNNANRTCTGGNCEFQSCQANFGNCDLNTGNGCETDLRFTTAHCGACNNNCATKPHVIAAQCSSSTCQGLFCEGGWGNCDGNGGNGCEQTLTTLTHCGGCNFACTRANATPTCATGACAIASCNPGWGNCDFNNANGCEQTLTTLTHCGGCNVACTRANATASCSTGACALASCNSGWANVDGNSVNGCEAWLNSGPVCSPGVSYLGAVRGDQGADILSVSGIGERWYRLRIDEADTSFSDIYLSAQVALLVPSGVDYDLYVYCFQCAGTVTSSAGTGPAEIVNVRRNDDFFTVESFDVYIEIRWFNGTSPQNWTLQVNGNTVASTQTCN